MLFFVVVIIVAVVVVLLSRQLKLLFWVRKFQGTRSLLRVCTVVTMVTMVTVTMVTVTMVTVTTWLQLPWLHTTPTQVTIPGSVQ